MQSFSHVQSIFQFQLLVGFIIVEALFPSQEKVENPFVHVTEKPLSTIVPLDAVHQQDTGIPARVCSGTKGLEMSAGSFVEDHQDSLLEVSAVTKVNVPRQVTPNDAVESSEIPEGFQSASSMQSGSSLVLNPPSRLHYGMSFDITDAEWEFLSQNFLKSVFLRFQCRLCLRVYQQCGDLLEHQSRGHSKVTGLHCAFCSESFAGAQELLSHLASTFANLGSLLALYFPSI
jgi:hypothetical protein